MRGPGQGRPADEKSRTAPSMRIGRRGQVAQGRITVDLGQERAKEFADAVETRGVEMAYFRLAEARKGESPDMSQGWFGPARVIGREAQDL